MTRPVTDENRQGIHAALDGKALFPFLEDEQVRFQVDLTRTADPDQVLKQKEEGDPDTAFWQALLQCEEALFAWFEQEPGHPERYLRDPIGVLKEVTELDPEHLERLQTLYDKSLGGVPRYQMVGDKEPRSALEAPEEPRPAQSDFHRWETSLPNTGSNTISLQCYPDNLYAGGNGYVYALNPVTGDILKNNDLKGRGKHEVRFAISEDGKHLFVGTDGYALSIDTDTFHTEWERSLPHTGTNVISLLRHGDNLYAAGNGYVYKLDPATGKILKDNGLKGRGKHEVRLAVSDDGNRLFLGTDGYALCLDASSLGTQWQRSLPHTGTNVISPLYWDGVLYAGGDGYVYKLDALSGEILKTNGLEGRGYHEVRLALSKDKSGLFVGTDGYALRLDAKSLETQWQINLPDGSSQVSLLVQEATLNVGSNGYFYQLDVDTGTILFRNNLKNRGHHEVRLALSPDGSKLFLGTDGYALGIPSCGDPSSGWNGVLAIDQEALNKGLDALYADNLLPKHLEKLFTYRGTMECRATLDLEAPQMQDGAFGNATAGLAIKGKLTVKLGPVTIGSADIDGAIGLTADLTQIALSATESGLTLTTGTDLFTSLDLSRLKITTTLGEIDPENYEEMLREALNRAFSGLGVTVPMNLPPILEGSSIHLSYCSAADADKNFLGVLFDTGGHRGNLALYPQSIDYENGASMALILSNRTVMSILRQAIYKPTVGPSRLSNNYPSTVKNDRTIYIDDISGIWVKVNKDDMRFFFDGMNRLKGKIAVGVRNYLTLMIWNYCHVNVDVELSAKEGDLFIKFTFDTSLPWWFWTSVLGIIIKEIIESFLNGGDSRTLPLPFDLRTLSAPAYVQCSGSFM